jgi:hypothetical protein
MTDQMTDQRRLQNKWRPALEFRSRQGVYQALADLSTLLLFFSLATVISLHQAFGCDLFRQSAHQSRDVRNNGGDEKDIRALEPGKPLKREMASGQRHAYQIRLDAGQFLKVIVEQQGIDVVVQIYGPNGNLSQEFDGESRLRGEETVAVVDESAGDYHLTVRPRRQSGPAGSYEIRIGELRAATENDRTLHESRLLFDQALKLRGAGKYDEALISVQRALEIREKLLGPDHPDVTAILLGVYLAGEQKWSIWGSFSKRAENNALRTW